MGKTSELYEEWKKQMSEVITTVDTTLELITKKIEIAEKAGKDQNKEVIEQLQAAKQDIQEKAYGVKDEAALKLLGTIKSDLQSKIRDIDNKENEAKAAVKVAEAAKETAKGAEKEVERAAAIAAWAAEALAKEAAKAAMEPKVVQLKDAVRKTERIIDGVQTNKKTDKYGDPKSEAYIDSLYKSINSQKNQLQNLTTIKARFKYLGAILTKQIPQMAKDIYNNQYKFNVDVRDIGSSSYATRAMNKVESGIKTGKEALKKEIDAEHLILKDLSNSCIEALKQMDSLQIKSPSRDIEIKQGQDAFNFLALPQDNPLCSSTKTTVPLIDLQSGLNNKNEEDVTQDRRISLR